MSKKVIIIAAIATSGALIAGAAALASINQSTEPEPVKEYSFTELGAQCTTGAANYRSKAQNLEVQSEKDYAALQAEANKTQAMLEANASYNTSGLNSAREDYLAIYNQGGMTREEYEAKIAQLDAAQATAGTPSSSIQSEINRIRSDATKHYEESKQKVADMQASAVKLESCANSAEAQRDFAASDVAEFEALISSSY